MFLIRAAWFLVVGWWLGIIWLAFCLTFTLLGGFLAWPITSKFWNLLPVLTMLKSAESPQRHEPIRAKGGMWSVSRQRP